MNIPSALEIDAGHKRVFNPTALLLYLWGLKMPIRTEFGAGYVRERATARYRRETSLFFQE
jgi:hypothetical protein